METTEILILVQTIILFFTGAIVFWYTVETNKIRKETQRQNTILSEQLLLLRETKELEVSKELSLSAPKIIAGFRNSWTFHCKNVGAMVTDLSVSTDKSYSVSIYPTDYWDDKRVAEIKFSNLSETNPKELFFTLSYKSNIGLRDSINYKVDTNKLSFTVL